MPPNSRADARTGRKGSASATKDSRPGKASAKAARAIAAVRAEVAIPNAKGLHARASARFVKCAEAFDAEVTVSRDGQTVGGTSIMGLMMLAAAQGQKVTVEARGRQARAALKALVALVESGFDER